MNRGTKGPIPVGGMVIALIALLATPGILTAAAAPKALTGARAPVHATSPYARAAAQHARAGQSLAGRAPTRVQGMGRPHKPHGGLK
jgi:hypothetical protein